MRVLFWLNSYLPDIGGIQTLCSELIPRLQDDGHEIKLVTNRLSEGDADRELMDGVDVVRIDGLRSLIRKNPGDILRSKKAYERLVDSFDPDVMHIHPCGPDMLYYLPVQIKKPRPTVATLHNNYGAVDVDFRPAATFGRALQHVDHIAAVSDDARQWLVDEVRSLDAITSTVLNGVRLPDLAGAEPRLDPPVILSAGRIEAQKRLDVLIDAFALVAKQHTTVRLRIVGSGTLVSELKHQAIDAGVSDRIDFAGRVDPSEVPAEIDRSVLVALSSDFEGLPMVALEAAGRGRPIVTTDVGGMREVVQHEETGWLVPRGDVQALADALSRGLSNPELLQRMGDRGRRRVETVFSLDRCAITYGKLYRQVVKSHMSRAG